VQVVRSATLIGMAVQAPWYTDPDQAMVTQTVAAGAARKPSRLQNAWQDEWYRSLPETHEGRASQAAADRACSRSTKQRDYTDAAGRREHGRDDRLAAASERNESAQEAPLHQPVVAVWDERRGGPSIHETASVRGAAGSCAGGRGRSFVLKDVPQHSRREMNVRAAKECSAPWVEAAVREGVASAWGAAGAAFRQGGADAAEVPGRGWRFIVDPAEGATDCGTGHTSISVADSLNRGRICHVGDAIESNVDLAKRKDFGWSFITTADEGPRPDGPRDGFESTAQGLAAAAERRREQNNRAEDDQVAAAGKPATTAANWAAGLHIVPGGMAERGPCNFQGAGADPQKHARRNAENRGLSHAVIRESDNARRDGLSSAWSNSVRTLRDPAANWTKPRRPAGSIDRRKVQSRVDCHLRKPRAPKPAWLARAERSIGSAARATIANQELKLTGGGGGGSSNGGGRRGDRARGVGKVARVARAKGKQVVDAGGFGGVDAATQPSGALWQYLHMQAMERPQGQPAGTRGKRDPRPQDQSTLSASDGRAPRQYRGDQFDRAIFFKHMNEDGTTKNAIGGHFANRYMGRDDFRETPWGTAELKPEPRVSRPKGEAGLNGYGSRKTYWDKWNEPILNNEPNANYIPPTGIPSTKDPTQEIAKTVISDWESMDPARKGVIVV
jgi:hypothetical protein